MTCPCGDAMVAAKCHECERVLCDWHWAANLLQQSMCLPSCASPYWGAAKSFEAVLSEVKARPVSGARGGA